MNADDNNLCLYSTFTSFIPVNRYRNEEGNDGIFTLQKNVQRNCNSLKSSIAINQQRQNKKRVIANLRKWKMHNITKELMINFKSKKERKDLICSVNAD